MLRANHDGSFPCRRITTLVPKLSQHTRRAEDRPPEERRGETRERRRPHLETLEPRYLMTASPNDWDSSFGGACTCSICTGQGLNQIFSATTTTTTGEGTLSLSNPLSSIPQLSSNSGATAKLFLDFNGHTQANWGSYSNVITPVYDQDGDRTTFSNAELNSIQEIWARVAEDYASFNIDVTTIDPGGSADRVVARIAIGGNYSDWFGSSAGGVAYIGGFYNGAPNVGYVFEDALGNGNARYVAEAASHEAGHLFGLNHQSLYNGTTLVSSYYEGNAAWAPIMGVGYYSQRTTWHNGTSTSSSTFQDDMSILANASNGFGYRADDYGSTQALAAALTATGGNVSFAGRIGSNGDEDWFTFTTSGGALNLSVNVAQVGANLDSVLELRDATGTVLVTANPTNSLSATLSSSLASGTYFVVVRSTGGYGNVGQYTLTGTAPIGGSGGGGSGGEETPEPEINVLNGTVNVQTGGTISFGNVQVGSFLNKTITIRNTGPGVLNLQSLVGNLPTGFTLISDIANLTLATNQSTTFTIRLTPTVAGAVNQTLTIGSNDADESAFTLQLTGTATPAPQPEINVLNGTVNVQTGGTISFGSVQVGKFLNKTITIKNTGPGALNLQSLVGNLPTGFTLVSDIANLTLASNQSTTFTVRLTPTVTGAVNQTLTIGSNDADESTFTINLTATATPAPAPEINVLHGTVAVASGGNVNFGSVQVSKFINKTLTIKNTGNATLTLVRPTAGQMPAGFTIVTNLATTTLAAGASTTITLRYTPTAVGNNAGTLTLVSNDSDEGSYVLNLSGTATPGPQPEININVGTLAVQTGGEVDFGSVQVTKFVNKVITVKNTGTAPLALVKPTALQMPPGFTIVTNFTTTSLAIGASASITLRYTPTAVGDASGSLTLVSNDADEGSFVLNLTGTGTPAPPSEINVAVGTVAVQTGGAVDFGTVAVGTFINKTITIKNTGPGPLVLQSLNPATMPAGYTIVTNLGLTTLATNQSTSFTIRFTPSTVGAVAESITLTSNDADEGSFVINLSGSGTIIRAIDNGAAGFTTTGTWARTTYFGREGDIHTAVKGTGTTTATWTFSSLPPGVYRVHASWTASTTYATNAPFTVFDGDTPLTTVLANQERASAGLTWGGTAWSNLGTFEITGDTVKVVLTNAANDRVVADAVRIEWLGALPEGAAAASSPFELDALPLPNFSPANDPVSTSFSNAGSTNTATHLFWATASSNLGSGATVMTTGASLLTPNSVDEVFATSDDASAELLLLNRALDLVRTTSDAVTGSNPSSSITEELDFDSLPPNWLAGDELSELLN
ncbi:choice-of-anchor D domain-containing protein [Anatilimnocola sp. NA78]|uniref:choice-of-anchor D domain-containing protein n=1 Tax=Anatilimnocola sp. NA78 TaxID=3415683 RepID=UPI003CE5BA5C